MFSALAGTDVDGVGKARTPREPLDAAVMAPPARCEVLVELRALRSPIHRRPLGGGETRPDGDRHPGPGSSQSPRREAVGLGRGELDLYVLRPFGPGNATGADPCRLNGSRPIIMLTGSERHHIRVSNARWRNTTAGCVIRRLIEGDEDVVVAKVAHPSVEERRTQGRAARERSPLSGHAGWVPAGDRPTLWACWRRRT